MLPYGRILVLISLLSLAADWRQFRGSDSTGVIAGDALPKSFDKEKNIAWTADLPGRGVSGPIVVGDKVFLTASSGPKHDRLHMLAFDAANGKQLWQRTIWATGPTDSHPKTCMAAPTPASDGKHVVALFATNDLVCLDMAGNVQWIRSLYEENPGMTDGRGLASSPIIAGNTIIVYCENQNVSLVAGIDLETGANRWRKTCSKTPNWTTPILLPRKAPAESLVLLQGTTRLSAVEPATGKEAWGLDVKTHPIASSVLAGNILLVPGMESFDAFQLEGNGPPTKIWDNLKLNPDTASPLVLKDRVFILKGAVLTIGDLKTGEVVAQVRLKGQFSASPVSDGSLVVCFNEEGTAFAVQAGEKEPTSAPSALGETILCTPAIANGALYVRSDKHLWKIAGPKS